MIQRLKLQDLIRLQPLSTSVAVEHAEVVLFARHLQYSTPGPTGTSIGETRRHRAKSDWVCREQDPGDLVPTARMKSRSGGSGAGKEGRR